MQPLAVVTPGEFGTRFTDQFDPIVFGAEVPVSPNERCFPLMVTSETLYATCDRCREAKKAFDRKRFDEAMDAILEREKKR
jgi:hypothetical protein